MTPRPRPSPTSLACACPSVIGPPPESHRARANVVLPIARVFRPDERGMDGRSIEVRGRTTGGGHLRTRPTIRPRTRLCPVAGTTRAPGQPGSPVTSVRTGVQDSGTVVGRRSRSCGSSPFFAVTLVPTATPRLRPRRHPWWLLLPGAAGTRGGCSRGGAARTRRGLGAGTAAPARPVSRLIVRVGRSRLGRSTVVSGQPVPARLGCRGPENLPPGPHPAPGDVLGDLTIGRVCSVGRRSAWPSTWWTRCSGLALPFGALMGNWIRATCITPLPVGLA